MDTNDIRYFGSDVCHGPDGPLTPDHGLLVFQDGTQTGSIRTVADLVAQADTLITPVSYDILPF